MPIRPTRSIAVRLLVAVTVALAPLAGCSTAPKTPGKKAELHQDVQEAIQGFKQRDPTMQELFDSAAGYAVFPTVGKGGAGLGGAYGRGEVYEGGTMVGYCDLSQGTIGFQLGGQTYSELIFFEDEAALRRFKSGHFAFVRGPSLGGRGDRRRLGRRRLRARRARVHHVQGRADVRGDGRRAELQLRAEVAQRRAARYGRGGGGKK